MAAKSAVTIKYASIDDVDELANRWTDEILACRSGILTHNWEPLSAVYNKEYRYTLVTTRCPRCTTRKRFEIDDSGRKLSKPRYMHGPGYLAKGVGRIMGDSQDWLRKLTLERGIFEVTKLSARESRENPPSPSAVKRLTELSG